MNGCQKCRMDAKDRFLFHYQDDHTQWSGHYDEEDHMGQGDDHTSRETIRNAKNDPSSQNLAIVVD